MSKVQEVCLFSGSSHYELAKEISEYSQIPLGKLISKTFPDGETFVQIQENVRGKACFVLQSLAHNPNTYLMELLIMIDALRRASAESIIVLIPYYAYSRQDRKDKGRVPITAKLVANLIEKAGADRVVTMDLHTDQVQGFFDIPTDNLHARPELIKAIRKLNFDQLIVGAPDVGSTKLAKAVSDRIESDLIIIDKRRLDGDQVELSPIIGSVKQKNVLFIDDICSTATTLCKAADACKRAGALSVHAMISHGLFAAQALEKIEKSQIEKIFVSNTISQKAAVNHPKIEIVSIASIFGEAVKSILHGSSISSLFAN
ncbi:MAG: Ribose-phosphate pyrophosphokinase [Chlamydiae bacterium]|nr:Ribose-phosphate pyrophosphokinase [Chlamydiota bacterium]